MILLIIFNVFVKDSIVLLETLLHAFACLDLRSRSICLSCLYSDSIHCSVCPIGSCLVPVFLVELVGLELWTRLWISCLLNSSRRWLFLVMGLGCAWIDFRSVFLAVQLPERSYLASCWVLNFDWSDLEMSVGWLVPHFAHESCSRPVVYWRDSPWCVTPNCFCPGQHRCWQAVDLEVHQARQERAPMPMLLQLADHLHSRDLGLNYSWVPEIVWCFVRWN